MKKEHFHFTLKVGFIGFIIIKIYCLSYAALKGKYD